MIIRILFRSSQLALIALFNFTGSIAVAQNPYYYPPPYGYYPYPPQPVHERPRHNKTKPPKRKSVKPAPSVKPSPKVTPDPAYPPLTLAEKEGQLLTWDYSNNLSSIARKVNTSAARLLELNKLTQSELREGQVLRLPSNGDLDVWSTDDRVEREIWRGPRGLKRIALTFDAGADYDHAQLLVKNLIEAKAPASFFITGAFAEDHPEFIKSLAAANFPVHNHSWSHPDFTTLSPDEMADELDKTDKMISSLTGKPTKPYWRPPFGDRDERVLKTTADAGYRSIYWTIDSLDSVDEPKDASFVLDRVLNPPKTNSPAHFLDGAIVLMHVGKKGTAEAVPELVRSLRSQGFQLVTVEELLTP